MSDSDKTKEQLIEELKALREQSESGASKGASDTSNSFGLTRRDVLSGWVAPVILTVPLIPRSGMAAAEGGGNDFTAFPTRLEIQADDPAGTPTTSPSFSPSYYPTYSPSGYPTSSPTTFQTPSTIMQTPAPTQQPTFAPTTPPTSVPTQQPTFAPTTPPTSSPTQQPTASPTITIPVELTGFEVNG